MSSYCANCSQKCLWGWPPSYIKWLPVCMSFKHLVLHLLRNTSTVTVNNIIIAGEKEKWHIENRFTLPTLIFIVKYTFTEFWRIHVLAEKPWREEGRWRWMGQSIQGGAKTNEKPLNTTDHSNRWVSVYTNDCWAWICQKEQRQNVA